MHCATRYPHCHLPPSPPLPLWCCCQFIALLMLLLVCHVTSCVVGSQVPHEPPCYCSFALFFYIVGCYSFYLCFGVVLPLSSPCRWLVSGPSRCYTCPTTRYPPSPFNPSPPWLLGVGLLCCFCHGEVLPPPIALCMWWNSSMIENKGKQFAYAYKTNCDIF